MPKSILLACAAALALASAAGAAPPAATLLPVRGDVATGRILLQLPPPDADGVYGRFLYATAAKTGLGSAPIRIDHGMEGDTQVLAFRRLGRRVAITFDNVKFRAPTAEASVQKGARESFPYSTVALVDAVSSDPAGGVTIDLAPFLARDTMNLAGALGGGEAVGEPVATGGVGRGWKLVESLSSADPRSVKAFPDNIEMEAVQTFASETPGREVSRIAPDARQVSFTVHHSLVRLPGLGFQARRFDIRSGSFAQPVYDYGTPLGQDVYYQLANHFRLEKLDPAAPRSRVKKPIVFWIEASAPEPIRQALVEGVGWWNQAFEAAGYVDAFQAKVLPADADPQDVRYNVVNWTNRLTRSWSYGGGIVDPRTGEIVKGNVVLGGDRARQDMVIFEGLVGAGQDGSGGPNDPVRVTLARIRQLGAHEVGHAIGLAHNFAASTQDRASVMDYPGPRIGLVGGRIDLSDAYATGIGTWDRYAIDWLYGQPAPGTDPDAAARAKAEKAQAAGLRYITDVDGRSADRAARYGSMWDDGPDPVEHLRHMLEVRRVALGQFGPAVLRRDEPLADLRRKFVPVWLLHRYAVDAAGKLVGGLDYGYTVAGDGQPLPAAVPAKAQLEALDAMLATLSARELAVPGPLTLMLSTGLNGESDPQFDTEVFAGAGAAVFDPLVAADAAAQVTLGSLLAPARLTRLYLQHARDPGLPGVDTLLDRLLAATVDVRQDAVGRRVAYRTLAGIAGAARDGATPPDVAMVLTDRLRTVAERLDKTAAGEDGAWARTTAQLIRSDRLADDAKRAKPPEIPPGMPIGGESDWFGAP